MDCPEARLSLGVYVLGAIDPGDRGLVDGHLASCRDCRDELAGLAGLPALLTRVSSAEAIALAATGILPPAGIPATATAGGAAEPPRELLGAVLDLAAARRRRRRWREAGLGIAAALIVAAGVFGGLRLGASPAPSPPAAAGQDNPGPASGPWQTLTASARGMSAAVSYRPMGWGTQLAVKVSGIPVGTDCQLWVVGPNGRKTLAGSWMTDDREGTVWYPASASVASRGVRGFQITVGSSGALTLTA